MYTTINISFCKYLLCFFKYLLTDNCFVMVTDIKFIFLSKVFQPSFRYRINRKCFT